MRMSRDMPLPPRRRCTTDGTTPRQTASADLLADQAVDLTAVRAALRLAHPEADDRAERLALAALVLLDGLRVRLERAVDDVAELVAAGHAEAARLDHRGGIAAVGGQHVEHLLGGAL